MAETKYTWSIVTYASLEEAQGLLDKAKHYAYCVHDKDWSIDDMGQKKPRDTHIHILATFEQRQSLNQVRRMIVSDQNTFAQEPLKNECIAGLFDYLIHEGENELEKHLYDPSERICDSEQYWKRRAKSELLQQAQAETFMEDLLADEISYKQMGMKYGRDFMKNQRAYIEYRNKVLIEEQYNTERNGLDGMIGKCIEIGIPMDEVMAAIYELYDKRLKERLYEQKQR